MIEITELKKPWVVECEVCKQHLLNWSGSTPCCGSIAAIVDDPELSALYTTRERLASLMHGREYREEISSYEELQAKASELIVIFGASDDLLEFRGAISEELGAWEGVKAVLYRYKNSIEAHTADAENIEDEIGNPRQVVAALEAMEVGKTVEASWCPKEDGKILASWLIKTDLPHSTFDIMEEGELYCRGVIIDVADLIVHA